MSKYYTYKDGGRAHKNADPECAVCQGIGIVDEGWYDCILVDCECTKRHRESTEPMVVLPSD